MFCPNCGNENPDGAAFCAGCGMAIAAASAPVSQPAAAPVAPAPQQPVAPAPQPQYAAAPVAPAPQQPAAPAPQPQYAAAPVTQQPAPQQPVAPAAPASKQPSDRIPFGQHFKNIFSAALHPVTGPAEIVPKYKSTGDAIILTAIVCVICAVVNAFSSTIIDVIDYFRYPLIYDGFDLVGSIVKDCTFPFVYYAVRIAGLAGLLVLGGLIVKEKWSFQRLLVAVALAVGPAYVITDLIGSFFGLIPAIRFGSLISTACYLYYIVMLYEGVSAETKLSGNKKAFVIVACAAIATYVAGFFAV